MRLVNQITKKLRDKRQQIKHPKDQTGTKLHVDTQAELNMKL